MSVVKADRDYTAKEIYIRTVADSRKRLRDLGNYSGKVDGYIKYTQGDKTLMAIEVEGTIYVTNSSIFMERFENIVELFGLGGTSFKIMEKSGKSGNRFLTCDIAE